jgi:hypothetical protein
MKWVRWFVAGALAVPLFHQVVLMLLHAADVVPRAAFSMEATEPFGVPQVISLSFWGGIWGVILGGVLARRTADASYWIVAIVFGAIAPTLVALFVANPLKGRAVGGDAKAFAVGALLNGAWGLGTALIFRLLSKVGGR